MHQRGTAGETRSTAETTLFSRALSTLSRLYSHPRVLTLKVTGLPPNYPEGFHFPPGSTPNCAGYHDRGWHVCTARTHAIKGWQGALPRAGSAAAMLLTLQLVVRSSFARQVLLRSGSVQPSQGL
jgi:hypothetical protein